MLAGKAADGRLYFAKRIQSGQVDLPEREPAADEVHVRVVEAWHDRTAAGIHDAGLGSAQLLDVCGGADSLDGAAANRDGFGGGAGLVGDEYLAIDHDQVRGVRAP